MSKYNILYFKKIITTFGEFLEGIEEIATKLSLI